ncbi:MAG: glutathione S-transferase family protein [Gammaproteobacteria bacterium]|nr:glutathione S-transferase family protein [Gammaproteobacteria bacterium]
MKLYCAWYCPFAQRAWMALEQKGIDYEYIEVDPYDKTDWWLKLSRGTALVPVLVQANDDEGEITIVESNRILEYLEDLYPEQNPIFADHPNARAEQKYWMDHVSNKITPHLYRYLKDPQTDTRGKLLDGLMQIVEAMDDKGPYFNGDKVSAVDIALMPFVYRAIHLLGYYRDFSLPAEGDQWRRFQNWYEAMLELPSFKKTSTDHDDYRQRLITRYGENIQGNGQVDVTKVN